MMQMKLNLMGLGKYQQKHTHSSFMNKVLHYMSSTLQLAVLLCWDQASQLWLLLQPWCSFKYLLLHEFLSFYIFCIR